MGSSFNDDYYMRAAGQSIPISNLRNTRRIVSRGLE
jgi:hypothetical protein